MTRESTAPAMDLASPLGHDEANSLYEKTALGWLEGRIPASQAVAIIRSLPGRCQGFSIPGNVADRIRRFEADAARVYADDWDETAGTRMARRDAEFAGWPT